MELTWLKIKTFFGKVWSFSKLYGGYVLLFLGFVAAMFALKKKEDAIKSLVAEQERIRKAHQDNLAQLQGQVEGEIERRQAIEKQYDDLMTKIRTEHDAGVQQIAQTKATEIQAIITRNHNNPEAMSTAINQLFGIPVIQLKEVP